MWAVDIWKLARILDSQASPQTYGIRMCIWKRSWVTPTDVACCGSRSSGFEDFKTSLQLKHSIILSIGMVVMALQDLLEYLTQSALWMSKQTRESYSHWNFKAKSSWPTGPWNFRKPLLWVMPVVSLTQQHEILVFSNPLFFFSTKWSYFHMKK